MTPDDAHSESDGLLERMEVLARFGDLAFRTDDLPALLQEAAALAAKGAAVEKAMVLELMPDGATLLLRAGVGWDSDVVGTLTVDSARHTPAGHALLTGEPAVVQDLGTDAPLVIPEPLRRQGVRSCLSVVIKGTERPFGVLEICGDAHRQFPPHDVGFLQGYANLLAAAIQRFRANQDLQAAAEDKARLLRELQHRVKNNLQLITSIVRIQRALCRSLEAQQNLEILANRLTALSLVHKQINGHGDNQTVELGRYLEDLCSNLTSANARVTSSPGGIRLDKRLERIVAAVDTASSIGLIVNEFVTNSLQHAFPDRGGIISITLTRLGTDAAQLVLADNGIGQTAPVDANQPGLGLQLIQSLADQLNGTLEWDRGNGTRATLTLPIPA